MHFVFGERQSGKTEHIINSACFYNATIVVADEGQKRNILKRCRERNLFDINIETVTDISKRQYTGTVDIVIDNFFLVCQHSHYPSMIRNGKVNIRMVTIDLDLKNDTILTLPSFNARTFISSIQ